MNFDFFYHFSWPGAGSQSRNFDVPAPAPAKSSAPCGSGSTTLLELLQNNFQYLEISVLDPDLYKICILDLDTYSKCGGPEKKMKNVEILLCRILGILRTMA